jgi:hypothetical protein
MSIDNYKEKYLKYKTKYINLKNMQIGGADGDLIDLINNKKPSDEIIQYINNHINEAEAYTEVQDGWDNIKLYPLEIAIDNNADDNVIIKLIEVSPNEAKNFLVIKKVIEQKKSLDIIKKLLENPESGLEKDGGHILSIALESKSSLDIISLLVEKYPESLKQKNSFNDIPLFTALIKQTDINIIRYLLEKYPDSAKTYNSMGQLPINYVSSKNSDNDKIDNALKLDVIKALYNAYKDGIKMIDTRTNMLPIHYSVSHDSSIDVTNYLIENYPDGIRIKNLRDENLPIHYSLLYNIQPETCKILKNAYPESVNIKNKKDQLPIDLAIKKNASSEIINMLMPTDTELLKPEYDKYK